MTSCCVCGNNPCNCPRIDYDIEGLRIRVMDKKRHWGGINEADEQNDIIMEQQKKDDVYWLSVAHQISKKSKCKKRQVGAVLVDIHKRVISTGYNGHPRHTSKDNVCLREDIQSGQSMDLGFCCHAEMNAIIFADFKSMQEATLYLTHPPCPFCARHIMQAGITSLVYVNDGIERSDGLNLLKELLGGFQWFDIREYSSDSIRLE